MTTTCSECGHTLPENYVGEDGLCFLCRPLTDEEREIALAEAGRDRNAAQS